MTEFQSTAYDPRLGPRSAREEMVMPILVYVGLLLTVFTAGLSLIVAMVAAYVLKGEAPAAARSHYVYALRTCWGFLGWAALGVVLMVIGAPLLIVLIGIPIMMLGGAVAVLAKVWFVVRAIVGIVRAADGRAQPNPRALLL